MNQYWIVDEVGDHALVTGAAERDRLLLEHWRTAEEPADGFVHIWHEGIELPGRVPVSSLRELWSHRGWVAGPPPGGVHPFAEQPSAVQAEPKSSKAASVGDAKKE